MPRRGLEPGVSTRWVLRVVDASTRNSGRVVAVAIALIAALGACASRLEVRSDLLELLPRGSARSRALEHQLGRVGGGSTLLVIVSSPDRANNEAFIGDLVRGIDRMVASCRGRVEPCAGNLVSYVESSTTDVRAFYERNKWLYADTVDLRRADGELDRQIALGSGLVEDLDDGERKPTAAGDVRTGSARKTAFGMVEYLERWKVRAGERDSFPTGFFANVDGTLLGLRIVSSTRLGDSGGERLLDAVRALVDRVVATGRRDMAMRVGFTGDLASASEEKTALVGQAAWATGLAVAVILVSLVLYYRSVWSLAIVGLPALLGVAAAYAFAELAFGYVNMSGAFLGAIILGNGINYPIVLLSRYQEFRRRGMTAVRARREAVVNALRAELVGACVASVAYGSLVVTRFRGFSQFGAIGFVGMLCAWASIVPLVPALIVLTERMSARSRPLARTPSDRAPRLLGASQAPHDTGREVWRLLPAWMARATTEHPLVFVLTGLALAAVAAVRIPSYVSDPWEYDLGKLGSRRSDASGAGEWSNKANEVFGGKTNVAGALMLADSPEQAPLLKTQMLANDARDPQGSIIAEIMTVDDLLPGNGVQQEEKLEVLRRIRSRLTPRVLAELTDDERRVVEEMNPPADLRTLRPDDLPLLLRRRFSENDGRIGTVLYVKPRNEVVLADGHNQLRLSRATDNVRLPDGAVVMTASRATIFAEMLESIRRDGPRATIVALVAVSLVIVVASTGKRGARTAASVGSALALAVTCLIGWAGWFGVRVNYVNFVVLPITLGIGCEYPFNIADRVRLLGGDVASAVERSAPAVMMCSLTTMIGYGTLLLSDFQALASFGKLAVVGEAACVFFATAFLPAALAASRRCGGSQSPRG